MKKTIKLVSILLLVMMVVVSCSPEKTMDGKTAETKKQMTSTEYSENRGAIQSVSVVEAYAVANPEIRRKQIESASKSIIKTEKYSEKDKNDLLKFLREEL